MKKKLLITVIILVALLIVSVLVFTLSIGPVNKSNTEIVKFVVEKGDTYSNLSTKLKDANLIRSEMFYKAYIKITRPSDLQIGKYPMIQSMSLIDVVNMLKNHNTYNPDAVTITFPEGINVNRVAKIIAANTSNTEDSVYALLKDNTFLDEMIAKYWFLSKDIKNPNIYYSLEGYLFPNTYEFEDKNVPVREIFIKMLDETGKQLAPYKADIEANKMSVHQLLTLASIVELESWSETDRQTVAGVFYNRINSGWTLGSCVTTYYASKVQMGERDLKVSEINAFNSYNTRNSKMAGKLPIGPICNPSIVSIKAALYPNKNDYFYFVSDKNKKLYFNKTYAAHEQAIQDLKNQGLWLEY